MCQYCLENLVYFIGILGRYILRECVCAHISRFQIYGGTNTLPPAPTYSLKGKFTGTLIAVTSIYLFILTHIYYSNISQSKYTNSPPPPKK